MATYLIDHLRIPGPRAVAGQGDGGVEALSMRKVAQQLGVETRTFTFTRDSRTGRFRL